MKKHLEFPLCAALLATLTIPSSAHADPREETLLPIDRKISTFSIRITKTGYAHFGPNDKPPVGSKPAKIIAIDGRNSKDIWMLTNTAVVLQDDGKEIKFRQAKPCNWGTNDSDNYGVGTQFFNIVVDENEVHVIGQSRGINTRVGQELRATLSRDGKWKCKERSLIPDHIHGSGPLTWNAAYNWDGDACRIGSSAGHCTTGPKFAPTHVDPSRDAIDMGIHNKAFWMHGPDDGWVVTLDERFSPVLYRFNGITWVKQAEIDESEHVRSMWADEHHQVWITATTGQEWNSPSNILMRFDGKTLTHVNTPSSFATRRVLGHSSKDVWFGGHGDTIYQWDGGRLRQGNVPGEVTDMWVSSDDVAFFVLPEAIAFAAPSGETH